jgi:hypothetical protein
MGAITLLLYKIVSHHAGVFAASRELAILDGEPRRVFAESIINDTLTELRGQIHHLGQVERNLLSREGLGPFVGVSFVHLEQPLFVVSERFPFRKILTRLWQMHFCTHEIAAGKDDAYAQGIVRIPFSELGNYPRKSSVHKPDPMELELRLLRQNWADADSSRALQKIAPPLRKQKPVC